MRHLIRTSMLLAILALVLAPATRAQDVDIQGAWLVASITDSAGSEMEAQPGLFLFTGTHYTIMFVPGPDEREQFAGQTPTDAETIAAFGTIIANSGRYQVSGDQLTYRAYVAKNPNYMGSFPENAGTATVHIAGGDTLHWTWNEGFMGGTMFTLRRVEGTAVPWTDD